MKIIEQRLPQDHDKSFIVFEERGQFFPTQWHYHPEYELVLVTSSTGRRMVGDHIGYFGKGDLVFMGPKLPHVWVNDKRYLDGQAGEEAHAVVVQFQEHFLGERFFTIPEMEHFKKVLTMAGRGLVVRGSAVREIADFMHEMLVADRLDRLALLIHIFECLSSCEAEMLSSDGYLQKDSLTYSDRFSKVTEYVMKNFDQDISLPEAASVANMAVNTFCNFFRTHYRVTFMEYVNTVRIGYACKLLANTDLTIREIGYRCGFNNLGNFNKRFRTVKGMTPSAYRQIICV